MTSSFVNDLTNRLQKSLYMLFIVEYKTIRPIRKKERNKERKKEITD